MSKKRTHYIDKKELRERKRQEIAEQKAIVQKSDNRSAKGVQIFDKRCILCNHPDRQEMENLWMHYISAIQIEEQYGISRHVVYRHMRHSGLTDKRADDVTGFLHMTLDDYHRQQSNPDTRKSLSASDVKAVWELDLKRRGKLVDRQEVSGHINLSALTVDKLKGLTPQQLEALAGNQIDDNTDPDPDDTDPDLIGPPPHDDDE